MLLRRRRRVRGGFLKLLPSATAAAAAGAAAAAAALLGAAFVLEPRSGGRVKGRTSTSAVATPTRPVGSTVTVLEDLPPLRERPGFTDRAAFVEGPNAEYWRNFDAYDPDTSSLPDLSELTGQDAPYWLYHMGRFGYFAMQALASVVASEVVLTVGQVGRLAAGGGATSASKPPWTLDLVARLLDNPIGEIQGRLKDAAAVFRQDLGYIRDGYFKPPYDMSPRHRQWSPTFVAGRSLGFLQEAVATLRRSRERADTTAKGTDAEDIYPDYYRHTFHYQTNGWLSSESADVYETSTETLFVGRQDAMQRTTLVHIARFLGERWPLSAEGRAASGAAAPRFLEIACGTGRLLTFVRDNWPILDVTASDLSPFYLERARENNAYWERRFSPRGREHVGKATFVQANAEALPFEDESFDIVTSVYLFHELPAQAQDAVVAEVARVLAPGGLFVLTDSFQLGDRVQRLDKTVRNFGNFAEPYYEAYARRDLAKLAREHGLQPFEKEVSSATKSVSFRKPGRS